MGGLIICFALFVILKKTSGRFASARTREGRGTNSFSSALDQRGALLLEALSVAAICPARLVPGSFTKNSSWAALLRKTHSLREYLRDADDFESFATSANFFCAL